MFKFIENWKAANKKAREEQAKQDRIDKLKMVQMAKKLDNEMEDRWCPIISGKCRRTCINFCNASVFDWEDCTYNIRYECIKPKCKLWK